MVRELRVNKRDICGRSREGVTAAILMDAAQEGMKVVMLEVGGGGTDRDGVADAQQWAVQAGWIGKAEAAVTLKAWQALAIRRGKKSQYIVIEMGVGWAGATEGFHTLFDRVAGIDRKRQNIGDKEWTQLDFLQEFAKATKWKGGMVRGMADKAGARAKDRTASFGSIDWTKESLAQAFNKWRECGAGYYAGKPRSQWAQGGLDAVIRGIRLEKERDPHHQFVLENPAWSALRFDKQLKECFGESAGAGMRLWGQENREGVQILDVSRNLGGVQRAGDPAGRPQVEVRGMQGRDPAQASGVPRLRRATRGSGKACLGS